MENAELQNKFNEWNGAHSSIMDQAPELIKQYILARTKGQPAPFIDLRDEEPIYGYINTGECVMESKVGALAVIDNKPYILMANSLWDSLDDISTDTLVDSVLHGKDDQYNGFIQVESASWYSLIRVESMIMGDTLANIIWNLGADMMAE